MLLDEHRGEHALRLAHRLKPSTSAFTITRLFVFCCTINLNWMILPMQFQLTLMSVTLYLSQLDTTRELWDPLNWELVVVECRTIFVM